MGPVDRVIELKSPLFMFGVPENEFEKAIAELRCAFDFRDTSFFAVFERDIFGLLAVFFDIGTISL